MRRALLIALAIPMVGLILGCATVVNGTSQRILIASSPRGAAVIVDDSLVGLTPVTVAMSHSRDHIVRMQLDGYQPAQRSIRRRTSGWFWVNLLWLDLPGIAVDAVSGGRYTFDSAQVRMRLTKQPE